MGKSVKETQDKKFTQQDIVEAKVAMLMEEEEELESQNQEIKQLKKRTAANLVRMEEMAAEGREEERREVRNEVIVDNLRLVTQVIKKYGYFSPDKFQNGCIGLLKAADTFSTERGVPFGNYAAFCIEMEVRAAFRRTNRMFESKNKDYLSSIDAPTTLGNGDAIDQHELLEDPFAHQEIDDFIAEAEIETLFYNIIIPVIRDYGQRAKEIDMDLWQELEIQYFVELSMEKSQRQRITFTEMAKQLGTTPQNIRTRHKKVLELVKRACVEHGYVTDDGGRVSMYRSDVEGQYVKQRDKKHKKGKY